METGRTCGQLRLFASGGGLPVDARLTTRSERAPVPADTRSMERPLGPWPYLREQLSHRFFRGCRYRCCLAAGCPVIVKAHHSPPHSRACWPSGQRRLEGVRSAEEPFRCYTGRAVKLAKRCSIRQSRRLIHRVTRGRPSADEARSR